MANHMGIVRLKVDVANFGVALAAAANSLGVFLEATSAAEDAEFAELREHPDFLELDVAAASWYPETS